MSDSDEIFYCNCAKKGGGLLEFILKQSGIFHVGCGKEIQMPIITDKKEWPCEHITHGQDGDKSKWFLEGYCLIPGSWATCPIVHCGASRPKELNAADELDRILNSYKLGDVRHPVSKRFLFTAILEKFMLREK